MRIYDCFTFYNEFDLLEIRLNELYNHVDYFVLVESNQTFTNIPKPFLFDENKQRYSKFLDKIIHIKVNDMPNSSNAWDNETHQRNCIMRGLTDAEDDDIVIVSDCDEVLRATAVASMRTSDDVIFGLRMPLFNFKLNYMRVNPGQYDTWAMATRRSVLNDVTPNSLRNMRFDMNQRGYHTSTGGCKMIEHAGWHFGYLGNNEYLKDKARSFSHQEVNTPEFIEQIDVAASIASRKEWDQRSANSYKIVELVDTYFPECIVNEKTKYQDFILDEHEASVYTLLPT